MENLNPNKTEETKVDVKEELVAAKTNEPLVKGFRNKMVILPLSMLQKQVESLRASVEASFDDIQNTNQEQSRRTYQMMAQVAGNVDEMATYVDALLRVLKIDEKTVEAEVEVLKAERAVEAEAKQDAKLNRKTVDRASQTGDTVKIDFVGKIDGEAFAGGSAKGHHLKLGSGNFIPGFEEQLIGKTAGTVVNVEVKFPENYGNKELSGKSATFETTVLAVKEEQKKTEEAATKTE